MLIRRWERRQNRVGVLPWENVWKWRTATVSTIIRSYFCLRMREVCSIYSHQSHRPFFALTAHMNDANVSASFTLLSLKCRLAIDANTPWISSTSANTGICSTPVRISSSAMRRFDSRPRRGRFATVASDTGFGVGARDAIFDGSASAAGGGGSSSLRGDG